MGKILFDIKQIPHKMANRSWAYRINDKLFGCGDLGGDLTQKNTWGQDTLIRLR